MNIRIQDRRGRLNSDLRELLLARIQRATGRFGSRIREISITVDDRGSRGHIDRHCCSHLLLNSGRFLVLQSTQSTQSSLSELFDDMADKVKASLAKQNGKTKARRRGRKSAVLAQGEDDSETREES